MVDLLGFLILVLELDCYLGGSNAFPGSPMNLCHDERGTQSVCVGSLQALHSLWHPTSSLGLQQRIFIKYQRVSPCTCKAQSSTKDQPWIPFPTNSSQPSRLDPMSVSFYWESYAAHHLITCAIDHRKVHTEQDTQQSQLSPLGFLFHPGPSPILLAPQCLKVAVCVCLVF